mgnify:CR=1 FL=1
MVFNPSMIPSGYHSCFTSGFISPVTFKSVSMAVKTVWFMQAVPQFANSVFNFWAKMVFVVDLNSVVHSVLALA